MTREGFIVKRTAGLKEHTICLFSERDQRYNFDFYKLTQFLSSLNAPS
jgi:hypothetical protein